MNKAQMDQLALLNKMEALLVATKSHSDARDDADDTPNHLSAPPELINPIKPSGKICRGLKFVVPPLDFRLKANPTEQYAVWSGTAFYRLCGWDAEVCAQQLDGEICSVCGRIISQDSDLGYIQSEGCVVPVKAVQVYLEPRKTWVLVQVPDFVEANEEMVE